MKKFPRLLLRTATVLIAGLGLVLILALDGVDHRPYFREPYYTQTIARWNDLAASNHLVHGELAAGFGQALLTPTVNSPHDDPVRGLFRALPLAGYGQRNGRPATGTHDDLYVKAVALRVGDRLAVMVGADALIIPPEVADDAAAQLAEDPHLARSQLYLSATHTHASLGGWGEGFVAEAFAGGFQPGARTWFATRIVEAVRAALADLRPASFGHGRFPAAAFIRNRLVGPLGRVDPEFTFALVQQHQGRLGVLGSYAAHATVLSGRNMEFSADYPGAWQRAVEQATGGPAIFLAGAVGSHSPNPGADRFEGTERMGQALAQELLQHLPRTALTNRITLGLVSLP